MHWLLIDSFEVTLAGILSLTLGVAQITLLSC